MSCTAAIALALATPANNAKNQPRAAVISRHNGTMVWRERIHRLPPTLLSSTAGRAHGLARPPPQLPRRGGPALQLQATAHPTSSLSAGAQHSGCRPPHTPQVH
jgi:hypothetical protein